MHMGRQADRQTSMVVMGREAVCMWAGRQIGRQALSFWEFWEVLSRNQYFQTKTPEKLLPCLPQLHNFEFFNVRVYVKLTGRA